MAAFLYPLYTGASFALAIWIVGLFQQSWSIEKILLLAVLAGLIYDNITIYAGSLLGEGELLKAQCPMPLTCDSPSTRSWLTARTSRKKADIVGVLLQLSVKKRSYRLMEL
ncbi:MAG: hypothetical protein KME26_07730 [Oscillatoria princeps RMCB-10]|jgi:hypothetical protein|nr:hypothetical protein [Oscillatoria princeps RMCB-10]